MRIRIDSEFLDICNEIVNEKKNDEEWALIESSDMFQTQHYCGGYDETEMAFCFSFYDMHNNEYWFQLSLEEINDCHLRKTKEIDVRLPSD